MNKHIEQSTWEENTEGYPNTSPSVAIAITFGAMLIAYVVVEFIFGANDVIEYVANLIK